MRFLDAQAEVIRRCFVGLAAIIVDDFQYTDAATLEIGRHERAQSTGHGAEGSTHGFIDCVRPGELSPEMAAWIRGLEAVGLATVIELEPLPPEVVAQHWLEGGEPKRAVPFLMAAAQAGQANLRLDSATHLQARAAALLEDADEAEPGRG